MPGSIARSTASNHLCTLTMSNGHHRDNRNRLCSHALGPMELFHGALQLSHVI
jgi:hypothetical protein